MSYPRRPRTDEVRRLKREHKKQMAQKNLGMIMVMFGAVVSVLSGDCTIGIFMCPMGAYIAFTKEDVIV